MPQERAITAFDAHEITIHQCRTHAEYQAVVDLQKETWGANFTECVPAAILMVNQKIGGVTAGAFDRDGRLLGFVFGLTGVQDGRLVHWSDMLAIRKDARDLGLGRRLKLFQREYLLGLGIDTVFWTFDPLEARNAHLNLNRLGAQVAEYVEDMYANMDSALHQGIGMDRFIMEWQIADARVARILAGDIPTVDTSAREAPIVNTIVATTGKIEPIEGELPLVPCVRVEIPADIQAAKTQGGEFGRRWRLNTRRVFRWYLHRRYKIAGFYRDPQGGRCFYLVAKTV